MKGHTYKGWRWAQGDSRAVAECECGELVPFIYSKGTDPQRAHSVHVAEVPALTLVRIADSLARVADALDTRALALAVT